MYGSAGQSAAFSGACLAAVERLRPCCECLLTSGAVSTVHQCLAPPSIPCWWPAGAAGGGCAHQDEDGGRPSRPRSYESLEGAPAMTVKSEALCVVGADLRLGPILVSVRPLRVNLWNAGQSSGLVEAVHREACGLPSSRLQAFVRLASIPKVGEVFIWLVSSWMVLRWNAITQGRGTCASGQCQ